MRKDRTAFSRLIANFLRTLGRPFFLGVVVLVIFVTAIIALLRQSLAHFSIPHLPIFRFPKLTIPPFPKLKFPVPKPAKKKVAYRLPRLHLRPIPLIIIIIIGILSGSVYLLVFKDLPKPQELITKEPAVSTKIYDRNGQLLYKIYKDQNRSIVQLKDIPPLVIQSTLAIEDKNFYEHSGFSLSGILRALRNNLTQDNLEGGSTITQQLIKNTLLTPERTLARKIKELVLAIEVESYFTKDEILTMYFNQVGYGGPAYGIEEASQYYFDKPVSQLNLAEAALLAGLPQSPTTYSPFGARPELAITRQHEVLRRLVEDGQISAAMAEAAKVTPLHFATPTTDIKAPHFVMYVKDLLVARYGEEAVNQGGLEVTTSLDLNVQALAEEAIQKELGRLRNLHVTNAAALVTQPGTGEILAMVGSKNYFDTASDGQVNITLRPRQPGSSIKPVNYALALENGLTPASIIDDSPVVYKILGSPPYAPQNYDGTFHGPVTVRQALANSLNVPAVKILSQVGVMNMIQKGRQMGITTWTDPSRYGLSLTLGGAEVRMVDMAVVFGSLANQGLRVDLHPILSVTNYNHTIADNLRCWSSNDQAVAAPAVYAADNALPCPSQRVVNPLVAYQLSDILSDNQARSMEFGLHSILTIPGQTVAVKTGTTNSLRDNWTLGYTPDILVATWVGNNDNSPMSYVASGITGASPIWHTIMASLLTITPSRPFTPPDNVQKVTICPLTNTLTCAACPAPRTEYFIPGTEPKNSCTQELIDQIIHKNQTPPSPTPAPLPTQPNRDRLLDGIHTRR